MAEMTQESKDKRKENLAKKQAPVRAPVQAPVQAPSGSREPPGWYEDLVAPWVEETLGPAVESLIPPAVEGWQRLKRGAQKTGDPAGIALTTVLPPVLGGLATAGRVAGLAGTMAAAPIQSIPRLWGGAEDKPFSPAKIENYPAAFRAFVDTVKESGIDAAVTAAENELGAGWGTFFLSELIVTGVASPALAAAGRGLQTIKSIPTVEKALGPKLAQTLGPSARGARDIVGETLQAPWKAEQAIGRAAQWAVRRTRPKPFAKASEEVAEEVAEDVAGQAVKQAQPRFPHRWNIRPVY